MQRILVTGASGFLGIHIARLLGEQGFIVLPACGKHSDRLNLLPKHTLKNKLQMDLTDLASIESVLGSASPDAVVHAAAMADLGPCEKDKALAHAVNTTATHEIAKHCNQNGLRMIFLSTDQVFSGKKGNYNEDDPPDPIHEYGRTKAAAERLALESMSSECAVVRVALVYGKSPTGRRSCSEQVVNALNAGETPRLFTDEIRNPISAEDVASAVSELIRLPNPHRRLHLGGPEILSRYDIGISTANAYDLPIDQIEAVKQADLALPTPRPPDLSLDTSLARKILKSPPRTLKEGLARLLKSDRS